MHINCPRILAFFWGEKTFRLNKPTASSVAFSLCGFQASKLSGIKDHFSDASWSPSSLGWWFLWVWDFFVGETRKWNMTARSGRGLVGSFVAWLFWLVGSSTTSTTTKKKSNQEQRRTIYDALNINFEWCQLLRLLICCWLGKVDDTKVALFTNYDHIQLVHLNKILIDSTRGAPNSTGWAPTIVVNAVTWGP